MIDANGEAYNIYHPLPNPDSEDCILVEDGLLIAGLNIIAFDDETIKIFVPITEKSKSLSPGKIETFKSRYAVAQENAVWKKRLEEDERSSEERKQRDAHQRIRTASVAGTSEEIDRHNQRLLQTEFSELVGEFTYMPGIVDTAQIDFWYHPNTGKIISFEGKTRLTHNIFKTFPIGRIYFDLGKNLINSIDIRSRKNLPVLVTEALLRLGQLHRPFAR